MADDNDDVTVDSDPDKNSGTDVAHLETHPQVETPPENDGAPAAQEAEPSDPPAEANDPSSSSPPATQAQRDDTPASINLGTVAGVGSVATIAAYTRPARQAAKLANKVQKTTNRAAKRLENLAKTQDEMAADLKSPSGPTSRIGKLRQSIRQKIGAQDAYASKHAADDMTDVEKAVRKNVTQAAKDAKILKDLSAEAKAGKSAKLKMDVPIDKAASSVQKGVDGSKKLADDAQKAAKLIAKDAKAIPTATKTIAKNLEADAKSARLLATDIRTAGQEVKVAAGLARGAKLLTGVGRVAGVAGAVITVGSAGFELYEAHKTGDQRQMATATGDVAGTVAGGVGGYFFGMGAGALVGGAIGAVGGFVVGAIAGGGVASIPAAIAGASVGWSGGVAAGTFVGGAAGAWYGASKVGEVAQNYAGKMFDAKNPNYQPPGVNASVPAHTAPKATKTNEEWTAFNMTRLKNYDYHGNKDADSTLKRIKVNHLAAAI